MTPKELGTVYGEDENPQIADVICVEDRYLARVGRAGDGGGEEMATEVSFAV